ncbi:Cytochrome P450 87A3 [Hibiscus syriacus]|uniref:Cytochrome P450 87A3 n=1 Tax=Hibiscus syriacus TaxID=106335 RepID=A0A6A2XYN9_HIBSY|nr:Cytochrome P450 87A3 [Hibiscus syriacus]
MLVLTCIGALFLICVTHWVNKWRNPRCNGKLPPGSMGFPLVGETLRFFVPYSTFDIAPFDPDLNHFVFQQEGQLFQSWYPDTFTEIFGRQNVGSLHGFTYKYLKNMVLNLFGPERLKKMLPEVENTACRMLQRWSSQKSVELKEATASMIFDLTARKLISYDQDDLLVNLRGNFVAFIQGLISSPLDIPGTAYYMCLQGKCNENAEGLAKLKAVSAPFETTPLALTLAVKFLSDNPSVLNKMSTRQIYETGKNTDSGLTWREYKSMTLTYTFQFINETVRLAYIVPGIFRKTPREIHFKGYTIPAGWEVMVCPPAVHLNPEKYQDPLIFNPSRWEGTEMSGASRNFMEFGGGMRFCVGTDFTKVQMAVFPHCQITKYR